MCPVDPSSELNARYLYDAVICKDIRPGIRALTVFFIVIFLIFFLNADVSRQQPPRPEYILNV